MKHRLIEVLVPAIRRDLRAGARLCAMAVGELHLICTESRLGSVHA